MSKKSSYGMAPPFKGFNFNFKRINWPLLLVHSVAIFCLILGGQFLVEMVWEHQRQVHRAMVGMENFDREMSHTEKYITILWIFGGHMFTWFLTILLGCVLSGRVVRRRGESAAIPVLLFSGAMAISWPHFHEHGEVVHRLHGLLRLPHVSRLIQLGLVGGLLVVLGLVCILLTWNRSRVTLTPKANR
jgi:hypothetical protein